MALSRSVCCPIQAALPILQQGAEFATFLVRAGAFMLRVFFALSLALCGMAKAETYNIQVWPDDLDKVPCEAWKKNADGSLTQTGTIVVANSHSVITANTFTDAATLRVVEKKCGAELK
jgi:hypothetical protein